MPKKKKKSAKSGRGSARHKPANLAKLFPNVEATLTGVLDWMADMGVPGAFVGAVAVILHGHVRTTEDVDIQVFSDAPAKAFADSLAAHGFSPRETPNMAIETEFAKVASFMRLRHDASGVKVDVMIGRYEFHRELVARRKILKWDKRSVPVISLDYLMVMKLLAGRAHDLDDARRLIEMHPKSVDRRWVMHYVGDMALQLEIPERIEIAREILGL